MTVRFQGRGFMVLLVGLGGVPAACQNGGEAGMEEASANFDLEDVQPVLGRIASLIEAGFTAADASVLAAKIAAQSVDSEQEYEYEVRFGGRDVPLRVVVFMDDVEAPDIAFFAPRDLAQQIDATIGKYMEEVGK